MVPLRLEVEMPTTLTLKNIPDAVYDRLKLSAKMHRRSMNSEVGLVTVDKKLLRAFPTQTMALPAGVG
jgi:antitoxin FitA